MQPTGNMVLTGAGPSNDCASARVGLRPLGPMSAYTGNQMAFPRAVRLQKAGKDD